MTNSNSPDPQHTENTQMNPQILQNHSISSLESLQSGTGSSNEQHEHDQPQHRVASHDEENPLEHMTDVTAADVSATKSNVSTKSKVPISKRRGILAQITLIPEYEDARDYSSAQKSIIVVIVAVAAICGPMGTSILLPAIDDVVVNLNSSVSVVNVSVGIYLLSLGIFPLWWSAFSEKHGRRNVYLISFTLFVGFSIGCALSPNILALIIFRVLSGGCSASVQAVGAGTIADLYLPHQRGRAMGWYYLGPLMGPFLSPILGGVVAQVWGWRATQWVMVIASGIADMLVLFLLPETLRKQDNIANIRKLLEDAKNDEKSESSSEKSVDDAKKNDKSNQNDDEELFEPGTDSIMPSLSRLTTNRSNYSKQMTIKALENDLEHKLSQTQQESQTRFQKIRAEAYEYAIRPLHSVVLLTYPPVLLVILYSSICFGLVYFFNLSISFSYARDPYNFSSIILGLLYIPNSVTYVCASIIGGRWNDKLLQRYSEKHNSELRPEARLSWNIVVACILFPPACMIFGWSLDKGVHWVVPLIGTAIFGFASMLIIGCTVTYLVDTLPGKGATGVALNNLVRQILAAIASFIVEPLIRALGIGVLYLILMGIVMVALILIIILKKKGDVLRLKYDLTKYYDKL